MAAEIKMPKLGAEMESGRVAEWLKEEGSPIREGEAVLVVETQKVAFEVEAPAPGFLHILLGVGSVAAIGETLAVIAATEDEYRELVKEGAAAGAAAKSAGPDQEIKRAEAGGNQASAERKPASPLARRIAREHGLDISEIPGTGPGGRVTRDDVLRALAEKETLEEDADRGGGKASDGGPAIPAPELVKGAPGVSDLKRVKEILPLRGMRRVIAERMFRSLQTTAQMTDIGELDVTELVAFREELLKAGRPLGVKLSFTDLMVKIVATALKSFPAMNATLEGDGIYLWENINIGVAVALEDGLIVPVVHNADRKSLAEINSTLSSLITRARERKLMPDDVGGGTFTISNTGSYGGWVGTPILNPPEVALLATGKIQEKPVVRDHQIVVRWMMGYSLTVDHRVVDGATGGGFIGKLAELLENPRVLYFY